MKVLLAFDAKVNALNGANLTPLDHVQGPQRFYADSHLVKQTVVDGIVDTLKTAGANRSKDLPRKEIIACVPKFKRFLDERESNSTEKWSTCTLPLYCCRLDNTIKQRLANISVSLTNTPDEAMALAVQMRELRMYQKAGSRILFLDGGGIRGLLEVEILSQVRVP